MNNIFDAIYVISLKDRLDRWDICYPHLKSFGIEAIRFVVDKCNSPDIWDRYTDSAQTHFDIMNNAKQNGYKRYLIFEDDVMFIEDPRPYLPHIKSFLDRNPWDLFYFGANIDHGKIHKVNPYIGKLEYALAFHAYAVNNTFYSEFESKCKINYKQQGRVLDQVVADMMLDHNMFISIPLLAVQRASFSNLLNQQVDYSSWMLDRYNGALQ